LEPETLVPPETELATEPEPEPEPEPITELAKEPSPELAKDPTELATPVIDPAALVPAPETPVVRDAAGGDMVELAFNWDWMVLLNWPVIPSNLICNTPGSDQDQKPWKP
jgi:hypothetical protein